MSAPLLRTSGLTAGYGGMPVLHDVELAIGRGEIVALVGSNGAGKTTLLRALSGLMRARGQIVFDGQDISGWRPERVFAAGLVQVPEGRQLFDHMTIHENLLMGAFRRRDAEGVGADLERVYGLFPRLRERHGQRAGSLSGGEQQMCAIARALMAAPRLLMVDEMSLGLAPVVVDQLFDILVEIRAQGVTVLLVEQDVFSAIRVADRGYVLEIGVIRREASAQALADDPEVQRAYFGL